MNTKRFKSLSLLVAALVICSMLFLGSGCFRKAVSKKSTITGTISLLVLQDDQVIDTIGAGALVWIYGHPDTAVTANSSGVYSMKNISPGVYTIKASLNGYESSKSDVVIGEGNTYTADIPIQEGLLFEDTFASTTLNPLWMKWNPALGVENGQLKIPANSDFILNKQFGNFLMEFDVNLGVGTGEFSKLLYVYVRKADPFDKSNDAVMFELYADNLIKGYVKGATVVNNAAAFNGTTHKVKIIAVDGTVSIYLDGSATPIGVVDYPSPDLTSARFTNGCIGFFVWGTDVFIDNIKIFEK